VLGLLVACAYRLVLLFPQGTSDRLANSLVFNSTGLVTASMLDDGCLQLTYRDAPSKGRLCSSIMLYAWDTEAPVYVSAGADGQPGVRGVDDEGNGTVDDRSELGATGSDDLMLTPEHPDYAAASSADSPAMILSRGAMRLVTDDRVIRGPAQIRIDVVTPEQRLVSRIVDLVALDRGSNQ
jgi:hypothetical protein